MARIRIALTVDKDVFDEFKQNLKSYGYPAATASLIVQQAMENINAEFSQYDGMSPQLELFSLKPRRKGRAS
jgi:hypothetical protein